MSDLLFSATVGTIGWAVSVGVIFIYYFNKAPARLRDQQTAEIERRNSDQVNEIQRLEDVAAKKDWEIQDLTRQIHQLEDIRPLLVVDGFEPVEVPIKIYSDLGSGEQLLTSGVAQIPPSPWIPIATTKAKVVRAYIANRPKFVGVTARGVGVQIEFFDETGKRKLLTVGNARWSNQAATKYPNSRVGLSLVDIGVERFEPLDVAIQYDGDTHCYAMDNETVINSNWRQEKYRLEGTKFRVGLIVSCDLGKTAGVCVLLNDPTDGLRLEERQRK